MSDGTLRRLLIQLRRDMTDTPAIGLGDGKFYYTVPEARLAEVEAVLADVLDPSPAGSINDLLDQIGVEGWQPADAIREAYVRGRADALVPKEPKP